MKKIGLYILLIKTYLNVKEKILLNKFWIFKKALTFSFIQQKQQNIINSLNKTKIWCKWKYIFKNSNMHIKANSIYNKIGPNPN